MSNELLITLISYPLGISYVFSGNILKNTTKVYAYYLITDK